jgi:hypothetical protein
MVRTLLAGAVSMILADVVAGPVSPLAELGPLAQMGVAGVVLGIWWIERKERRERQTTDDERYGALQKQLMDALANRIVQCPMIPKMESLDRNLSELSDYIHKFQHKTANDFEKVIAVVDRVEAK